MSNKHSVFVNITSLTVIKLLLILVLFYILFLIKDILAILFIALILASAVDPWVDWLQDRRIPRGIGVILIYFVMFFGIVAAVALVTPPIIEQTNELTSNLPAIVDKMISGFNVLKDLSTEYGLFDSLNNSLASLTNNIPDAAGGVFTTLSSLVGNIFSFFVVLVITFYMVVEEKAMKKIVWSLAPPKYQMYIMGLVNRMQKKIGLWLRGQLILSLIIFTLTFIGLTIMGVRYALVLAFIAGLTEFVPYLGPILASIPAIFLSFTQSPMLAVFVAILYYVVQLTENNIIVPKLMQKVVGLNPIVSIAVLLIGFKIGGIAGAVLSIPVTTALSVFLNDIFEDKVITEEIKETL